MDCCCVLGGIWEMQDSGIRFQARRVFLVSVSGFLKCLKYCLLCCVIVSYCWLGSQYTKHFILYCCECLLVPVPAWTLYLSGDSSICTKAQRWYKNMCACTDVLRETEALFKLGFHSSTCSTNSCLFPMIFVPYSFYFIFLFLTKHYVENMLSWLYTIHPSPKESTKVFKLIVLWKQCEEIMINI